LRDVRLGKAPGSGGWGADPPVGARSTAAARSVGAVAAATS